ncbi:MAG: hypothetical protein JWQ63_1670 [Mucilaginibacter sp.]|nr:hypothetical protein [Mucilaginibacter sp.]
MEEEQMGIWPPHEAFYLESMLTVTRTAMYALGRLQVSLKAWSEGLPVNDYEIIDYVQNLIIGAGAISRYFWPSDKKPIHQNRAKALRDAFDIKDDNPLKDRKVRNFVEHFDENLDEFLAKFPIGVFMPSFVGERPPEQQVRTSLFRAYYVDDHTFHALEHEYAMLPIIKELHGLHQLLEQAARDGGRLPG